MCTYGCHTVLRPLIREYVVHVCVTGASDVPMPPDSGCVCYALRTGFSSSQGKLVRMIEGSTESVRTDTRYVLDLLVYLRWGQKVATVLSFPSLPFLIRSPLSGLRLTRLFV